MGQKAEELFWTSSTTTAVEDALLDASTAGLVSSLQNRLGDVMRGSAPVDGLPDAIAEKVGELFLTLHGENLNLDALSNTLDVVRGAVVSAVSRKSPLGFERQIRGSIDALFHSLQTQAVSPVETEPVVFVEEVSVESDASVPVVLQPVIGSVVVDNGELIKQGAPVGTPGKVRGPGRPKKETAQTDESPEDMGDEPVNTDEETEALAQRAGLGSMLQQHMRSANKYPLLTREQEGQLSTQNLAGQVAEEEKKTLGETISPEQRQQLDPLIALGRRAYDRLVCSNLKLVVKIAFGYINLGLDIDDLVAEGNGGLMKAAERFDAVKGKFSTYAAWWIKQSIKRALANQGRDIRLPVHMVDKIIQMRKVAYALEEELGREPTDEEIAAEMGGKITAEKIYEWRVISARPVSLDAQMGHDGDGATVGEVTRDEGADSADEIAMHASDMSQITTEFLATVLDERELAIIMSRFALGGADKKRTLEEIGRDFEITRERIRQLQNIALAKLKRALEKKDTGRSTTPTKKTPGTPVSQAKKPQSNPKGVIIEDEITRKIIYFATLGTGGAGIMSVAELSTELGESEADIRATQKDMGIVGTTNTPGRKPTSKKKFSLPALEDFVTQTKEELLANSHLNNRHPVQRQILEKILDDIVKRGITTGYIHEPARVGKTAIYTDFIRHYFNYLRADLSLGKRVFLVVPSTILMEQVPPEIQKFFPQVSVGAYYGGEKNLDADVVVITYASFNKLVEEGVIKSEDKECIILDEAHEALSDMRQDIIGRFSQSIRLGGTATSELGDERSVEGLLQHEYHRMSIVQAIEYGLIAPYWVIYILTETDLSDVKMLKGDYADAELGKKINSKSRNSLFVKLYQQCFQGKKAIAYCGIVKHSHDLRNDFNDAGFRAVSIDSSPEYDDEDLKAFRRGEFMIATNPFKLVQGFDDPDVEVIFSVRPTFSPRVVGQSCPRGQTLREGKACSYIVESVDATSGRFPLTYEEFVLRDHKKTTGDDGFSLDELRTIMAQKIQERGGFIQIPHEIDGHLVASDPAAIKFLFESRDRDRDAKLRKEGITPGNPPDDWASYAEFGLFANIRKEWIESHAFKVCLDKGFKFSKTIKKYKIGNKVAVYMPPVLFPHLCATYKRKNDDWQVPSEPFSRRKLTAALTKATPDKPRTVNETSYQDSFTDLAVSLSRDVSFFETYALELFVGTNVKYSTATMTYEGGIDVTQLRERIKEKQMCEITLADIAQERGIDMLTLITRMSEALQNKNIALARMHIGYIHIDHWVMIEEEVCSKK